MRHQFAHAVAFVYARPHHFEHRLAWKNSRRLARKRGLAGRDMRAQAIFVLRPVAEMQRQRIAFVLDLDAGIQSRCLRQLPAQIRR